MLKNQKPKIKIKYQEHSLQDIIRYFLNGFEIEDDQKIIAWDYFIDTKKEKAVLRLTIKHEDKEVKSNGGK